MSSSSSTTVYHFEDFHDRRLREALARTERDKDEEIAALRAQVTAAVERAERAEAALAAANGFRHDASDSLCECDAIRNVYPDPDGNGWKCCYCSRQFDERCFGERAVNIRRVCKCANRRPQMQRGYVVAGRGLVWRCADCNEELTMV